MQNKKLSLPISSQNCLRVSASIFISMLAMSGCATQSELGSKYPTVDFMKADCRPQYPIAALHNNQQGTVYLSALVRIDGTIYAVNINKSSSHPILDDALRDALLRNTCKATPGSINGIPTEMTMKLQYVWQIVDH